MTSLRRVAGVGLLLAGASVWPAAAAAQQGQRYALVVAGASGDPEIAALHKGWTTALVTVLRDRYKIESDRMAVLVEEPDAPQNRSTAENVRVTLGRFAKQVTPQDVVFIMLIGHGGGAGSEAKFNLIGPDLTVADWNELLKPLPATVALVNAASASFPFIQGLAGPRRIIISATATPGQVYHPMFADAFIRALNADIADTDKNGRLSLLEVFVYASRLVTEHYERLNQLPTEKPVFDDSGDGQPRDADGKFGDGKTTDGDVAALTYLDTPAAPTSSDPEIRKLLERQQALNNEIDELRKKRQSMPPDVYDKEFERLIGELAMVSAELRKRGRES
jgi:hypothetical protein